MTRPIALALLAACALAGCKDRSMTQQNRYGPYTPAALFPHDTEAQPLPSGVVAQGDLGRAKMSRRRP